MRKPFQDWPDAIASGQVITETTFSGSAVGNQSDRSPSGDFACDNPLALFEDFCEKIYDIDGAEEGTVEASLMDFAELGGGDRPFVLFATGAVCPPIAIEGHKVSNVEGFFW